MKKINKTLTKKLTVNQWKNTEMVIHWFKSRLQKSKCFFIQFDIREFYPSITEKIGEDVIVYPKQNMEITEKDLRIIIHCRKSLLYHEDIAWKKEESESWFDVIIGKQQWRWNLWTYWNLYFITASQILYHKKTVACTGMMVWYYFELQMDN